MSKKESSVSTIEVRKDDAPKSGDSKMNDESRSRDPQILEGEIAVIDKAEEPEIDLTKEIVEQPTGPVQQVADGDNLIEKIEKEDEALVPSESLIMASLGLEETDVVVVDEDLNGKDEAQVSVSVEPSLVNRDNKNSSTEAVNAGTCKVLTAEVDATSKDESSHATIEVVPSERCKTDVDADVEPDEGISVETQCMEIKTVADSSKPPTIVGDSSNFNEDQGLNANLSNDKSLHNSGNETTTLHIRPPVTDVVVVDEDLNGKDEAQVSVTVERSLVNPDNKNSSTEAVNAGTCKVLTTEVDATSKDEIEVLPSERCKTDVGADAERDEVTTAEKDPNSDVKDSIDGGISVENQRMEINTVADSSKPSTILGDSSNLNEDQGLNANLSNDKSPLNSGNEITTLHIRPPVTDVVVVEEDSNGKDEAQVSASVEPSLANPDNNNSSTEAVNAGTCKVLTTEVDATSKDESSHATIEVVPSERCKADVGADVEPDEATTAEKDPNSDLKDSTDGGILAENQRVEINTVTDSSKPPTIVGDSSIIIEDQGLNANLSDDKSLLNSGNETTTLNIRSPDSTIEALTTGEPQTYPEHGILPANSEFSYEEGHLERGEDAGMDIDEVLGWKDEITGADESMQENEQNVGPTNLSSIDGKVNDDVEEQETEVLEHSLEAKQWNETSVLLQQSCYFRPPENEGEFCVSDLVWGKIRSHPWWPGQIFDPSDASEKAMKYHKKDGFLVAYFGDRTFAWNDSTDLKPFRSNFSQIEKNSSSESFNNAVHCALEEVSRRVELGLTCSCIPHEIYENIKCQIVENSGIRQESSRRHGVDKSASVNSFEPDKLVDYVRLLARFPYGESDKIELTITKAQLSSYGRFKGYRQLAEFLFSGDLLEDASVLNDGVKQIVKDDQQISDKNEIDDGTCSKKRKALDSISDGSEKRPSLHPETAPAVKPSFKVGACIQKVASQLSTDQVVGTDVSVQNPGNTSNQSDKAEMLSQLHLAAQDPMKGHNFLNTITPFFYSHRAAVVSKLRQNLSIDGRKRKPSNENDPEEFEFDDVNDSYWTDRIIQNYPEEQMPQENQNGGGGEHQIVAYEQDKQQPVKPTRRSNKKRFFSSNHEIEAKEQSELIERRRQNLATEVLMKFAEGIYFPSEIHLNKMFKRFGPLMESETEVDRQSGRARVVFKKCSDAEVAHSSAGKFNIFGSINVNYELNYTPLISYKPLPLPLAQDPTGAC